MMKASASTVGRAVVSAGERPLLRVRCSLHRDGSSARALSCPRRHAHAAAAAARGCDVLVAGGGVMGSATAFFTAQRRGTGKGIVVVEKDRSYARSSTALSVGSIRHQFSTRECVQMSLFGTEFLRNIDKHLNFPAGVTFRENGYLFLAATNEGAQVLEENHALQRAEGAHNALLSRSELAKRFPFLATDDLLLGCLGLSGEGWFDPQSLLNAFREAALRLGVLYVDGEVTELRVDASAAAVTHAAVRAAGRPETAASKWWSCGQVVNATGPSAAALARRLDDAVEAAGVRRERFPLPVEPRKRCVFVVRSPPAEPWRAQCPLVVDPAGFYFRPEGEHFLCGMSPPDDPDAEGDFAVEYGLFDELLWPAMAQRVPEFAALKLVSAWAGHYEYNTFDQNALLGPHPHVRNFLFVNGFSGHGIQHAAAAGRALSELLVDGRFRALDLSVFEPARVVRRAPIVERNVV